MLTALFFSCSFGAPDDAHVNPELEGYDDQLVSIVQDAPGIVAGLSDSRFYWQPSARWSIGHCFEHLNLTAKQFEGPIQRAITTARQHGWTSSGPFAYRLIERLFVRGMEPPPRMRVRTRRVFDPGPSGSPPSRPAEEVMREFYRWQERLKELIRAADGVDLVRARLPSPVLPVFRYSLGTCLAGTLAHERRHLWQARQVRNDPSFPAK